MAAGDDQAAEEARAGLGHELRGLIAGGMIDAAEEAVKTVLARHPYWPQAVESLAIGRSSMPPKLTSIGPPA